MSISPDLSAILSLPEFEECARQSMSPMAYEFVASGAADERTRTRLLDENGELKERIQELLHRSTIDALTGVFNRGYFDEQLDERAAVARASKHPLGLLFLDADHFKKINDTFGHPAGDATLKQIASVLMQIVRTNVRQPDEVIGDFYAQTVIERLGLAPEGLVRAGCACYTTIEEVDRLVSGVRELTER